MTRGDDASTQVVAAEIITERLTLRSEIRVWRDDQALYMPQVLEVASESPLVEDEILLLPSGLPLDRRNTSWFNQLLTFEMELRKGQAEDALSSLRLTLKYKDNMNNGRRRIAYGQSNGTRTATLLRRAADLIKETANNYRRARDAMLALGMSSTDTSYPELLDKHVTIIVAAKPKQLGTGKYTGSWIWGNGPRGVLSDKEEDEWEEEGTVCPLGLGVQYILIQYAGNKVEWFRAKLDLKQWNEEVEILNEELTRSAKWFEKMGENWRILGARKLNRGASEYTYQKAHMYVRRAKEARVLHDLAKAVKPSDVKGRLQYREDRLPGV